MSRLNANGSSITDLIGVRPAALLNGGAIPEWPFPELPGATLKAGEMVVLSGTSAGICAAGTQASGTGIIGFAADDAAGTTSAMKGVYVAVPGVVFVGNVGHGSTSASAQTAATDIGQRFGLTTLSGRTYVDKAVTAASNTVVRVIGFQEQDVVPSFYGKVYFHMLNHACQVANGWWYSASSPLATTI